MRRLLFAIACAMAGPAWADDVLYKCVDGKGAVSIQSAPCPKTSKEVWKRDTAAMAESAATLPPLPPASVTGMPPPPAKPGPPSPPGQPAPAPPPERSLASASVESLAPIGPPPPAPPPPDPCDHAKDVAAQLRDMPWLQLSHDQEQLLVRWVMEQCRPAASQN